MQGQRRWREGAGIVAIRHHRAELEVLLVNGKRGDLGFPKGGRKGKETGMQNAQREWYEESGLPIAGLDFYQGVVLVDAAFGCHYFVAEWKAPLGADTPTSWAPPAEDKSDPNPVVRAQWLPVKEAVHHQRLSFPRKELLKKALKLLFNRASA